MHGAGPSLRRSKVRQRVEGGVLGLRNHIGLRRRIVDDEVERDPSVASRGDDAGQRVDVRQVSALGADASVRV
jgi:hypothetical protein